MLSAMIGRRAPVTVVALPVGVGSLFHSVWRVAALPAMDDVMSRRHASYRHAWQRVVTPSRCYTLSHL